MGAIIGSLYACGMSPAGMIRFVIDEFSINDYLESFAFRINGPVGKVIQTGQMLASLATRPGIDRGQKLEELLEVLTGRRHFGETGIPFRCNAVDLYTGQEVIFSSGPIAKAVRASMSFPVFFEPLMWNGMCLVDGGLLNNLPVSIAAGEGFEHIIAVSVNRFSVLKGKDLRTGPQVIYRSIESVLAAQKKEDNLSAELTLNVTGDATPFSFYRQKEHIALGEKAVRKNIETLEAFFNGRRGLFKKPVTCNS
jgi:NTE family protein